VNAHGRGRGRVPAGGPGDGRAAQPGRPGPRGISWTDDIEGELQDTMVEVQTPPCPLHGRDRGAPAGASPHGGDRRGSGGPGDRGRGRPPVQRLAGPRPGPGRAAPRCSLSASAGWPWTSTRSACTSTWRCRPAVDPARLLGEARWLTRCSSPSPPAPPSSRTPTPATPPTAPSSTAGIPSVGRPRPVRIQDYERLLDFLVRGGLIPDRGTVYWTVRLNPRHPTIEFRGADACPSLPDAAALAALARAAVVHIVARGRLPAPRGSRRPPGRRSSST
jgi:hypothetical protein